MFLLAKLYHFLVELNPIFDTYFVLIEHSFSAESSKKRLAQTLSNLIMSSLQIR